MSVPLNIYFTVEFRAKRKRSREPFHSVSGLVGRLTNEEGHRIPVSSFSNLILKRAYNPNSDVVRWCMNAINNKVIESKNLTITLLDENHEAVSAWLVEFATPVSWGIEELNAQDTRVLLEVIELKYKRFQVLKSDGTVIAPRMRSTNRIPNRPSN